MSIYVNRCSGASHLVTNGIAVCGAKLSTSVESKYVKVISCENCKRDLSRQKARWDAWRKSACAFGIVGLYYV